MGEHATIRLFAEMIKEGCAPNRGASSAHGPFPCEFERRRDRPIEGGAQAHLDRPHLCPAGEGGGETVSFNVADYLRRLADWIHQSSPAEQG